MATSRAANSPKERPVIEDDTPVNVCVEIACKNLDRATRLTVVLYTETLEKEWFRNAGELRLAVKDGDAWRDLRLPAMLKMELKRLLQPRVEPISYGRWTKMFDEASETWYYYDNATGESQWEPPEDVHAVEPETSVRNGFRSPSSAGSPTPHSAPPTPAAKAAPSGNKLFVRRLADADGVQQLVDMGFTEDDAVSALLACDNDVNRACNVLTTRRS